jgi:hypothetical protein
MSTTVVCLRVKSHPEPTTESSMRKCDQCSENIWLADSSPKPDHLICVECYKETERMEEQIFHKTPVAESAAQPPAAV